TGRRESAKSRRRKSGWRRVVGDETVLAAEPGFGGDGGDARARSPRPTALARPRHRSSAAADRSGHRFSDGGRRVDGRVRGPAGAAGTGGPETSDEAQRVLRYIRPAN